MGNINVKSQFFFMGVTFKFFNFFIKGMWTYMLFKITHFFFFALCVRSNIVDLSTFVMYRSGGGGGIC